MRTKLAYKLFLTFVITGMVSMVLMMGLMHNIFRQELREFVISWEIDRFKDFAGKLGDAYKVHRTWEGVKNSPLAFRDMLFPDISEEARLPLPGSEDAGGGAAGYGPSGTEDPCVPEETYYPAIRRRVTIYDPDMHIIAGRSAAKYEQITTPIKADGQTVGWLGLIKRTDEGISPQEETFLRRQTKIFSLVVFSVLTLSILISVLLSRSILRPVGQITRGAQAMSSRKFDTRIDVKAHDELGNLVRDFNLMAEALERGETLRKQMISDVSHDLRTPVAILRGEIEAMLDGIRAVSVKNIESLYTEVMFLEKLANDLHELSLVDPAAIPDQIGSIDVLATLRQTMDTFGPQFAQASVSLSCDPAPAADVFVTGDGYRFTQVFSNLLENSLRYTDSPGELKIRWMKTAEKLHLTFDDTGPGVPDESLDKLFDRLYRADPSRSRRKGSSGLGLAICKGIVESLFEGKIQADHSPLGGLRITITLPTTSQSKTRGST